MLKTGIGSGPQALLRRHIVGQDGGGSLNEDSVGYDVGTCGLRTQ